MGDIGLISKAKMTSLANAVRSATGATGQLTVDQMTTKLGEIGGEPEKVLRCYDYDGTVVYEYTMAEALALESLPDPPANTDHLTFQGWNWSLANIKSQFEEVGGYIDIGAVYITDDGATRLYVDVTEATKEPYLGFGVSGTAVIDWGDGSATDSVTGTYTGTTMFTKHTYAETGSYCISISGGNIQFNGGSSGTYVLTANGTTTKNNDCYRFYTMLTKVHVGSNTTSLGSNSSFIYCNRLRQITLPKTCDSGYTSTCGISIPFAITGKAIPYAGIYTKVIASDSSDGSVRKNFYTGVNIRSSKTDYAPSIRMGKLVVPSDVTTIKPYAYAKVSGIDEIVVPDHVTSLSKCAFESCPDVRKVTLHDGLTTVGSSLFQNCYTLTDVTLPSNLTAISANMFYANSCLREIVIPDSVTSIEGSAFYNCFSLDTPTLPDGIKTMGGSAFNANYCMKKFKCPANLTAIYNSTFYDCWSLEEIELPKGLLYIASGAFTNCYSLKKIVNNSCIPITAGVDATTNGSIGKYATEVIGTVRTLTDGGLTINVSDTSKVYAVSAWDGVNKDLNLGDRTIDGETYECIGLSVTTSPFRSKTGNTAIVNMRTVPNQLLYSLNGLNTLTIGDRVKHIETEAFSACYALSSISGLANVESVGAYAFSSCLNITSISLPHVKTIESSAFINCVNLAEINLGDSLEVLGRLMFSGCGNLPKVVFPATIKEVGDGIFSGTTSKTLDFRASTVVPKLTGFIGGLVSMYTIIVPDSLYDQWITATNWSQCASQIVKASEYTE